MYPSSRLSSRVSSLVSRGRTHTRFVRLHSTPLHSTLPYKLLSTLQSLPNRPNFYHIRSGVRYRRR
ncbi:hypothetical protein BU24DRAFT_424543 [Aaosphaeria arxii CBS 175.79]|uniref:Uncharacterized protein n=1 Tax=Aaosphaeria arxii CBS 175.79 TaxID=1450172 RepID=A0A6A5XJU3_9PLEO|nr:uncharacterized protein BU24DRAFT_424543 [Aaosphaeria arxii CBS 175.79]KAF2013545.1 hypothetical protein BU24DRAFT_424543 [Aaosphaeria arxii CBS 175.79]